MTFRARTAWLLILAAIAVVACATLAGAAGPREDVPAMCAAPAGGGLPPGDAQPAAGMHGHCADLIAASGQADLSGWDEAPAYSAAWARGAFRVPRRHAALSAEPQALPRLSVVLSLHHLAVLFLI